MAVLWSRDQGQQLVVVNTHLSVHNNADKQSQLAELEQVFRQHATRRVVVVGDFNIAQQPVWDDGERGWGGGGGKVSVWLGGGIGWANYVHA